MTPYELREGVTGQQAAEALCHLSIEAGNLPAHGAGRDAAYLLDRYLTWAGDAERQLASIFLSDVMDDLLHTPNYWALRASTADSPRLIPMVLWEAESRKRVLDELQQAYQDECKRWQFAPAMLAVPDTNMFLQEGAPFQDVDWPKELESRGNVRVVIPLVVIHELDRLKRYGNNTARTLARTSLRWLHDNLPLRQRVPKFTLTTSFPETSIEVYVDDVPTRPEDADGLIIHLARRLGQVSQSPTRLVTRDLGMRLRAAALGVEAVQLPD